MMSIFLKWSRFSQVLFWVLSKLCISTLGKRKYIKNFQDQTVAFTWLGHSYADKAWGEWQ